MNEPWSLHVKLLRLLIIFYVSGRSKRQIFGGGYGYGHGHNDRYGDELAARIRELDREEVTIFDVFF
jgi:hypothetical protein